MPRTSTKTTTNGHATKPKISVAAVNEKLITDPYEWIVKQTEIQTSAQVEVPTRLIEQVIGQDLAVDVAAKAASQRRHLLLIGDPGTGKSMIAKAMAEMLPAEKLDDVLVYHNQKDPNNPKILKVDAGKGREVIGEMRHRARRKKIVTKTIEWALIFGVVGMGAFWFLQNEDLQALFFGMLVALFLVMTFKGRKDPVLFSVPKLMIEHDPKKESHAAYVEATGSHAGALLGDVRHDPFQSGGLETPPHDRVEVGAIHRAHKGVLFIDEINVLRLESQQALLSALQERVFAIVGQSQTSSGAMVRTDPVPCDFILVAAGNQDAVQEPDISGTRGMHPALRSRIRGYGYEVYVNSSMEDTHENRLKLVRFIAQEVKRDGRIPHFEQEAIAEVILEAQRRSGQRGELTLRLRELGGLVRTAGDIAAGQKHKLVTAEDVRRAKRLSRSLEQQMADAALAIRRKHDTFRPSGELVGIAAGMGLIGSGDVGEPAGLVVPIASAVTPSLNRNGGQLIFGGGIEKSAKSQTEVASALLKTISGDQITLQDVHLQSLVAQEGVESEGCGIALAVSAISALLKVPVRQDCILIGSITVNAETRAVRGVTQQIESAVDTGYRVAVVPESNRNDVLLNAAYRERVEIVFVSNLVEALQAVLVGERKKQAIDYVVKAQGPRAVGKNGHGKTVEVAARKD